MLFVPGRVCLLGEHTDWSGGFRRFNPAIGKGYTLVVGTNQGLYAEVRPHPSSFIVTTKTDKGEQLSKEIPMQAKALLEEARTGSFFAYAAGVAYKILMDYRVAGLVINNYRTTLPIGKGLSSSAAVCVLVARAFSRIYDLKMTVRGEMEYAYQGEILTPSMCGRLDQACAFGSRTVLMTYDGEFVDVEEVSLQKPMHFVIVDLCAQKDTTTILRDLQKAFPFAEDETQEGLHELLGPINARNIDKAQAAMSKGETAVFGAVMNDAAAAFRKYGGAACPSQLQAPILHRVLEEPKLQPLIHGGKGIGAGGDGTAQLLCRGLAEQAEVVRIVEQELGMSAMTLDLEASTKVRRALIPAAGFMSSLFPMTKAIPAPLFPIVDSRDGLVKPTILLNVEEVVSAGVEEVVIVVQERDVRAYEELFKTPVEPQNFQHLSSEMQMYAKRVLALGELVTFIVQEKQEGFGHAVLCARKVLGNEPFLLVLGDHIYRTQSSVTCAQQMLDAYKVQGTAIMGLKRSPESTVSHFGTVGGVFHENPRSLNSPKSKDGESNNCTGRADGPGAGSTKDGCSVLHITEVREKPTMEYARDKLRVSGLPEGEYLTAFGMYVVEPIIFDYLEYSSTHNIRDERGKMGFTEMLDKLRQEHGLSGIVMDGERFDVGDPESFISAVQEFSQPLAHFPRGVTPGSHFKT